MSEWVLVHRDGYRERELATAESIAELAEMAAEKAGRQAVADGGDHDGDS